jgi:replicative DNA helicase
VNQQATRPKQKRSGVNGSDVPLRTELIDRQPPFDLQAEAGVIGSVMLLPSIYETVEPILKASDFYDDAHRGIWLHFKALRDARRPIDLNLLIDSLKEGGDFEAVGGAAYIKKIFDSVPNAAHAVYYAEIVHSKALKRQLIVAATEILRDAYADDCPAEELVSQWESANAKIGKRSARVIVGPVRLDQVAAEVCDEIENPQKYSTINRAWFGLGSVDNNVGAVMPGEVCIIGARPGNGKTSLLQQIMRHSAEKSRPGIIVSLEMTHHELATRELCRISRIDSRAVREGDLSEGSKQELRQAQQSVVGMPFYMWAPPRATLSSIRSALTNAIANLDIRVAGIDYIGLISADEENRRDNRREILEKISNGIKQLARELQIPIFMLVQLNREADDAEPTLRSIRECGAIEQDADIVVFLHSAGGNRKKFIVAKHRNGWIGEMTLGWIPPTTTFFDPEEEQAQAAAHF